jgi:hypothetical protein
MVRGTSVTLPSFFSLGSEVEIPYLYINMGSEK